MRIALSILCVVFLFFSCKEKSHNSETEDSYGGDPIIQGISKKILKDPDSDALLFERSKLFYEREAYDQAIDDVESAMKIDSLNADYYHHLADIQLDYFKSRDAIKTLKSVVALYPDRIPSLLKLSEFYFLLQQYDESISTINNVVFYDPQNAEAYFMLGMNFRDMGEVEKSINSLQRAVELDADLTDAWIILGDLYEYKKDPIAYRYYDNATKTDPDNISALHSKAFYLQNNERLGLALEIYKEINEKDPNYDKAYLNTGVIYLAIDSVPQALEHFNIVTKIDPANPIPYYYKAVIAKKSGDLDLAKSNLRVALNLNPEYPKALELLKEISTEG